MTSYYDSHCHLQDDRLAPDLDAVMRRADDAGVSNMLCCSTNQADWRDVIGISRRYTGVAPACGIHPLYLFPRTDAWLHELDEIARATGCAIGEIGLDHSVEPRNDGEQRSIFVSQLRLARDLRRPVSIHCRRAWKDLLDILGREGGLPDGGVIHSYSGPPDLVPELVRRGCSFSFSGSVTRSFNKRGKNALAVVPPDRLLVETDSPDIPPEGAPREINEPANIALVAKAVAAIRGMGEEKAAELTFGNAKRLFGKLSIENR